MDESLERIHKAFADEADAAAAEQSRYQALALKREAYKLGNGPKPTECEVRLWRESMRSYLERARVSLHMVRTTRSDIL